MIARLYADAFGRLSDPIEPDPMRFVFDQSYQWENLPLLTSAKTSPAFALSMGRTRKWS